MNLEEKLNLILQYKNDIKNSLINKGSDIDSLTPLSGYAEKIDNLQTGSTKDYLRYSKNIKEYRSSFLIEDSLYTTQNDLENWVINGNLTIFNNIVSGFSTSNYLTHATKESIAFDETFSLTMEITTGGDVQSYNTLVYPPSEISSSNAFIFGIRYGNFYFYDGRDEQRNGEVTPNTKYKIKLLGYGSNTVLEVATEGSAYTEILTRVRTKPLYLNLGYNQSSSNVFKGSINISNTYLG